MDVLQQVVSDTRKPMPAPLPRKDEQGVSQCPFDDWVPVRPYLQVPVAQMQDFQGDGSVTLDTFSDQVAELFTFYHWDEQETCHQNQSHLSGTMLAYIDVPLFHRIHGRSLKRSPHETLS